MRSLWAIDWPSTMVRVPPEVSRAVEAGLTAAAVPTCWACSALLHVTTIAALRARRDAVACLIMTASISKPHRRPEGDGEVLHGEVGQRRVDPGLRDLGPDAKVLVDLHVKDAADARFAIEAVG